MIYVIAFFIGISTFIIVGVTLIISNIIKHNNCTLDTIGTIVGLKKEDASVGLTEYSGSAVYRPIILYEYNGHEYTYYHKIAKTSYKNLSIGMKVTMKINPNKPEQVHVHI